MVPKYMPNMMNIDVLGPEAKIFGSHLAKWKKSLWRHRFISRWRHKGNLEAILASRPGTSIYIAFGMDLGTLDPKINFDKVS